MRGAAVWLGLLILASLNGFVREAVIAPLWGATAAHVISTLLLSALILLLTWFTIRWLHPETSREAAGLGFLWLTLTLGFEFGSGRFLLHRTWDAILADYDLSRGRIWPLVLVTTLLAPLWAGRARGLFGARPS